MLEEGEHPPDQGLERHALDVELSKPHGIEERPDDVRHAVDLVNDPLEVLAPRMLGGQRPQDHLRPPRDDVERSADLVGEAGSELTRHSQRLRAPHLLLEIERVFGLGHQALPRFLELLGHAIERLGHLAQLVETLHGQRRPAPAFPEGADGVGQVGKWAQDLALEHHRDEQSESDGEGPRRGRTRRGWPGGPSSGCQERRRRSRGPAGSPPRTRGS